MLHKNRPWRGPLHVGQTIAYFRQRNQLDGEGTVEEGYRQGMIIGIDPGPTGSVWIRNNRGRVVQVAREQVQEKRSGRLPQIISRCSVRPKKTLARSMPKHTRSQKQRHDKSRTGLSSTQQANNSKQHFHAAAPPLLAIAARNHTGRDTGSTSKPCFATTHEQQQPHPQEATSRRDLAPIPEEEEAEFSQ